MISFFFFWRLKKKKSEEIGWEWRVSKVGIAMEMLRSWSKELCALVIQWRGDVKSHNLVSWCVEPSQPQKITSGLDTNFTLSPSYSFHKLSYHKSCFLSLSIFRGHSTREPPPGRVTFFFILRSHIGTMCQPRPTQDKSGEGLETMQVNGPEG